MRQNYEIKLPALHRVQRNNSVYRRDIRDVVDEALGPQTIGNELAPVAAIVENRCERPRPGPQNLCEAPLARSNLHVIASNTVVDFSGVPEFMTMPSLEICIAAIVSV